MKLSNNDAASLAELWVSMKNYIPTKERAQAAEHFLSAIEETALCDLESSAAEMFGFCSTLDRALREYAPELDEVEDFEEDDEW